MIPPNELFIVTNLLSLSPDNGASLENMLGSSILRINLSSLSMFNRFPSLSFTKKLPDPHSGNSFFIDQVPSGVCEKSGASFQNLSSTPNTCTLVTRKEPSGFVIVPRVSAIGATTTSAASLSLILTARSSSKKPSGESMAMSPCPTLFSAKPRKVERTESPTVKAPVRTIAHKAAAKTIPVFCLRKKSRFLKIIFQKLIISAALNFHHSNDMHVSFDLHCPPNG